MALSCIAIDDEILALGKVKRFISKINFVTLKGTFDNAKDAITFLSNNEVDLIFLDIEMPEINGFQLLNNLKVKPYVILTTAYSQYALQSYDFEINDYLLKPLQFERFLKAVEKVYILAQKEHKIAQDNGKLKANQKFIFIKSSGKIIKIFVNDILYIEGMKDYLAINTPTKRILTLMNFKVILSKLPKEEFIRIHKSFVVSKSKIEQIGTTELLVNGQTIPIGKTFKKEVQQFKSYLT